MSEIIIRIRAQDANTAALMKKLKADLLDIADAEGKVSVESKKVGKAAKEFDKASKSVKGFKISLDQVLSVFVGFTLANAAQRTLGVIRDQFTQAINLAKEYEANVVRLGIMFGDMEMGAEVVAGIDKVVKLLPIFESEAVAAVRIMAAFNVQAQMMTGNVEGLAKAALIANRSLDEIVLHITRLADPSTAGRAAYSLALMGFNVKQFGKFAAKSVMDTQEAIDEFVRYIDTKYTGAVDKWLTTTESKMRAVKANWIRALREMGFGIIKGMYPALQGMLQMIKAAKPLFKILGEIGGAAFEGIAAAAKIAYGVAYPLINLLSEMSEGFDELNKKIDEMADEALAKMGDEVDETTKKIVGLHMETMKVSAIDLVGAPFHKGWQSINALISSIEMGIKWIGENMPSWMVGRMPGVEQWAMESEKTSHFWTEIARNLGVATSYSAGVVEIWREAAEQGKLTSGHMSAMRDAAEQMGMSWDEMVAMARVYGIELETIDEKTGGTSKKQKDITDFLREQLGIYDEMVKRNELLADFGEEELLTVADKRQLLYDLAGVYSDEIGFMEAVKELSDEERKIIQDVVDLEKKRLDLKRKRTVTRVRAEVERAEEEADIIADRLEYAGELAGGAIVDIMQGNMPDLGSLFWSGVESAMSYGVTKFLDWILPFGEGGRITPRGEVQFAAEGMRLPFRRGGYPLIAAERHPEIYAPETPRGAGFAGRKFAEAGLLADMLAGAGIAGRDSSPTFLIENRMTELEVFELSKDGEKISLARQS